MAQVAVSDSPPPAPSTTDRAQAICHLCGQRNAIGAASCESCGAALTSSSVQHPRIEKDKHSAKPLNSTPLRLLQSWRLTVGLAIILVAVVVILKNTRGDNPHSQAGVSPNAASLIQEIESLQKTVDANPGDATSMLRLANLLHDVKFFPKAITTYERYLQLNPSNADARVDLGTSYFELSFTDSTRGTEFLQLAKGEMEKALSYAPKHQLAHFNLGIVSLYRGNIDDANDWFKKCIKINPNSETARRAQQLINQHTFNNPS